MFKKLLAKIAKYPQTQQDFDVNQDDYVFDPDLTLQYVKVLQKKNIPLWYSEKWWYDCYDNAHEYTSKELPVGTWKLFVGKNVNSTKKEERILTIVPELTFKTFKSKFTDKEYKKLFNGLSPDEALKKAINLLK